MGEGAQMDPLEQRIGRMARERLAKARIGIAGAGGLGSNIAMMLARSGVGHLVIADFDTVDESNLNRQHYAREHVGASKVDALSQQIHAVDPRVAMQAFRLRVTPQNARKLFGGCDIVCEAFDDAQAKAMLVEQLLSLTPGPIVVSGNGMAGIGPASEIVTHRLGSRLYVCGDGESDVDAGEVLYAPRVMLCAAQQALVAVRIVLGEE
ncbi:sulfur carrier protein ThiS adenylyltransferase ThiF [Collinsella tanakaei]|uniref:sulfur carrier protein ThiS adenylyltransferase ThiF n=1 Tax=Collinsella tanakaei TaxID=626935 RepID=UPI0025A3F5AD|nr:sulfur carrier protein ThiS adenylyltransferase ThiF [Collinsella tanakaei]MDM8245424.1 sulfur carrier protein ThiS adenylyltransferase ThiF [Collinsella tanakaei]